MIQFPPEKSNGIPSEYVPILTGKAAKYNAGILEALYEGGELTSWELARILTVKLNRSDAHDTLSVITRKKGRLNNLIVKGYIKHKDKKVKLTLKGLLLEIAVNPENRSKINLATLAEINETGEVLRKEVDSRVPEIRDSPNWAAVQNEIKLLGTLDGWYKLSKHLGTAVESGLNLDRVSDHKMLMAIAMFKLMNGMELEYMSKKS